MKPQASLTPLYTAEEIAARVDAIGREIGETYAGQELVVVCHHGVRSLRVAHFLESHGFSKLYNLQGGVDAWAREIDPAMHTY